MTDSLNGTLDLHLEPDPDGPAPRIVLCLSVDGYDGPFRVALSPERARDMARCLEELLERQARVGKAGEN